MLCQTVAGFQLPRWGLDLVVFLIVAGTHPAGLLGISKALHRLVASIGVAFDVDGQRTRVTFLPLFTLLAVTQGSGSSMVGHLSWYAVDVNHETNSKHHYT
uniref:Putative secreted protein n=1 Tax=Ixodes ricinus TaxID=34613 RepID=A0A6B0UET9_IXORI